VSTSILLVGDTHILTWEAAHPELQRAVAGADIALHAGDWVGTQAVEGFRKQARRSVLVHGNSDPVELRQSLPYREVIEVDQIRIGLLHPAWGREEFPPDRLGHFHETMDVEIDGIRFVNAGQGYPSFLVPGTLAWLRISGSELTVEIEEFAPPD
jgi:predicted phosphodiesterase